MHRKYQTYQESLKTTQEHINANVEKHAKEMMENTIVEPSTSPMAFRGVLVKNGGLVLCRL